MIVTEKGKKTLKKTSLLLYLKECLLEWFENISGSGTEGVFGNYSFYCSPHSCLFSTKNIDIDNLGLAWNDLGFGLSVDMKKNLSGRTIFLLKLHFLFFWWAVCFTGSPSHLQEVVSFPSHCLIYSTPKHTDGALASFHLLSRIKKLKLGWNTVRRMFILHAANSSLISGITYDSPIHQE